MYSVRALLSTRLYVGEISTTIINYYYSSSEQTIVRAADSSYVDDDVTDGLHTVYALLRSLASPPAPVPAWDSESDRRIRRALPRCEAI